MLVCHDLQTTVAIKGPRLDFFLVLNIFLWTDSHSHTNKMKGLSLGCSASHSRSTERAG